MTRAQYSTRAGLLLGLGAYLSWGVLPLYFKLLQAVDPFEIVAHRIVWSLMFLGALIALWQRGPQIRAALATPKSLRTLVLTALLIGINWLVWIWAVMNGHVLEGSLGYYLNPLVNVLFGVVLLKERLSRPRKFAVALAFFGVAALAWGAIGGLWISLVLALSFASYGYLRKVTPVDSLEGLTIETALLTPLAFGWIIYLNGSGGGGLDVGPGVTALLVLAGAVTAVPLLLFNAAAKRLPYSTLGFLQYIAPSMQFLLAVLVFGERLTTAHIVCFGAIWTALAIYAADGLRLSRAAARDQAGTAPA
jgi:chloramphenicol-sensitive protein RarD